MRKKAILTIFVTLFVFLLTGHIVATYTSLQEGAETHNLILSKTGFVVSWCCIAGFLYGLWIFVRSFFKK